MLRVCQTERIANWNWSSPLPASSWLGGRLQQLPESRRNGPYERIEQLLKAHGEAARKSGQLSIALFLEAASQICLACQQLQAEKGLHREALEDVGRRERGLRKQLAATIKTLVSGSTLVDGASDEATPGITGEDAFSPEKHEAEFDTADELVNEISRLLDLIPSRPESEKERREEAAGDAHAATETVGGAVEGIPGVSAAEIATDKSAKPPEQKPPPSPQRSTDSTSSSLTVYCFGQFQVYLNDQPVESWPSGKGKSVLKYLVAHRKRPVAREVLMDLFWPGSDASSARNNLNVAIYGLRKALRNVNPDDSHVLFQNGRYLLNPDLDIWIDAEEFLKQHGFAQKEEKAGNMAAAIRIYNTAESLYRGEFLLEDRYEEWVIPVRRDFQIRHLNILTRLSKYYFRDEDYGACITICHKMLAKDACLEDTHRLLMRCYARQGQYHLALRQYHQCRTMLRQELEVSPSPETKQLFDRIRRHDPV